MHPAIHGRGAAVGGTVLGMAGTMAIAATTNALRVLLADAAAASEWDTARIEPYQAADLADPPDGVGARVSIFLHRVSPSVVRTDRGPRTGPDGLRFRPSVPVDLHYLLTAWSTDSLTAQRLLGWVVGVVNDTPVLPVQLLHAYDAAAGFGPDETVEVVCETLSIADLYNVWQVAPQRQRPSAAYVARGVRIDSGVQLVDGAPVRVREFEYAAGPVS